MAEPLPCIRCGRCEPACPVSLAPDRLHEAIEAEREDPSLARCVECRACTNACPSRIDLLGEFRAARRRMAAAEARRRAADEARIRSELRSLRLERSRLDAAERRRRRLAAPRQWEPQ